MGIGHAAIFAVNSTTDAPVASAVVGGACETAAGNGVCTLRAAIQLANVPGAGATTINLPVGTYALTQVGPNENAALTGDLDITSLAAITISGAGAGTTIIDGNNTDRVFDILGATSNVSISGVTIRNGNSAAVVGGAINMGGAGRVLNLDGVVITGNKTNANIGGTALSIGGGGAAVTMTNVAITKNIPVPPGGGNIIDVGAGSTLTITNGEISGNGDSAVSGRGISALTNVTISGNIAVNAAGIDNKAGGTVNLVNCTVNANIATAAGGIGGIRNAGTVTLKNTIITNNTTNNCSGVFTSLGNNLSNVAGCGLTAPGDVINPAPLLGPLANNTGPLLTHALLPGSPAIDAGTAAGCPGTDARGIVRPVAGNIPPGFAVCDMGAFEFRPQKITVALPPPFDFGTVTDGATADHAITLANAGDGPLIIGTIAAAAADPLAPPFSVVADACSAVTLPLGASCTVTTRFAPTAPAVSADTFSIPSNDPVTPTVSFALNGAGVAVPVPGILVTDSIAPNNDNLVPFGGVLVGSTADATITVASTGTADLVIGQIASANPLAAPFIILNDTCSNVTVPVGASCTLTVRFAPAANLSASDSFDIPATGLPAVTVSVTGTATAAVAPTVTPTPTGTGTTPTPAASNNPPSNPVLVSPANNQTGVATTMTFVWKRSADPDGDGVIYHFMFSTDPNFVGAQTVTVASAEAGGGLMLAGVGGLGGGILLLGLVTGSGMKRSRKWLLIVPVFLVAGALCASCGGSSGGGSSTPGGVPPGGTTPTTLTADETSATVTGLAAGTTYFWKVVADDGKGGLASSETFSFKTQ
jgi:CSLREA domain-containing protein